MPGAPLAPAASRGNEKNHASKSHHRSSRVTRHSLRNGFNGLPRALPGDRTLLSPSLAIGLASLAPALGRQNHATSPSATARHVKQGCSVHRIPTHVRDARETPLGLGRNKKGT
jgi:hypothetical protein